MSNEKNTAVVVTVLLVSILLIGGFWYVKGRNEDDTPQPETPLSSYLFESGFEDDFDSWQGSQPWTYGGTSSAADTTTDSYEGNLGANFIVSPQADVWSASRVSYAFDEPLPEIYTSCHIKFNELQGFSDSTYFGVVMHENYPSSEIAAVVRVSQIDGNLRWKLVTRNGQSWISEAYSNMAVQEGVWYELETYTTLSTNGGVRVVLDGIELFDVNCDLSSYEVNRTRFGITDAFTDVVPGGSYMALISVQFDSCIIDSGGD